MLPFLAPWLSKNLWGPFRLFGSHMILIGVGTALTAALAWTLVGTISHKLARDGGRPNTPTPETALGKPTGAGLYMLLAAVPVLFFVLPPGMRMWEIIGCLCLAMLTGWFDDASARPWGEWKKGLFDLLIAVVAATAFCRGAPVDIWLPLTPTTLTVHPLLYVLLASPLLWICINATNCTDGVDGLAGSLTLLSLLYLGGFLYVVVGHKDMANYLLLPHNPNGARWAILVFTCAGALAGYLWHNAEPSSVLMGDAGSRFLGLLVGVSVLATGNPALMLVVAPVVLVNGGTGLVKVFLLRIMRRMGLNVELRAAEAVTHEGDSLPPPPPQWWFVRLLHTVRFPLHDHCRKKLGWSNAQVLLRFMLIQAFATPLFLAILVKVR